MSTLVIIESPGKKAKLEAILGPGYTVRASFGHVRDLPEHELGVSTTTWKPNYVVEDDRAKSTIATLKKAVAGADNVLLATDPDREGEAIAWHLAQELRLRSPQRIQYGEITEKAVRAAVASPRAIDEDLVQAQEARRVLDRFVGYVVSPALSDRAGKRLSAGRVQSPAVRLVVDRERAIRAFVATTHFGATLTFPFPSAWRATWVPNLAEGEYQLDVGLAKVAAAIERVQVVSFEDSNSTSAPPAPFTTSTLLQAAQAQLKIKPKQTMELAQRLYEQGAITYMRTDSPNLSDDAVAQVAAYAKDHDLPLSPKRRTWKAKGNAQEAHEAIRPAHVDQVDAGETESERALYRLIWSRTVASQLADATFAVRTAELVGHAMMGHPRAGMSGHPSTPMEFRFQARGRMLVSKGWKQLYDVDDDDAAADDAEDPSSNPVPALEVGAELRPAGGKLVEKSTKAPKRYTQTTLVKELEAHGIGRPATYASILENISRREYIAEDKKGQLSATSIGEQLVDTLVSAEFAFISLEYTQGLEAQLDQIAEGQRRYASLVADAYMVLQLDVARLPPVETHPCPACGAPLRRRSGGKGPFWGCSAYPTCSVTLPDADGRPGAREARSAPADAPATHTCPDCRRSLRRNQRAAADDPKGKGWDFWGCTGYPTCKRTFKTTPDGAPALAD